MDQRTIAALATLDERAQRAASGLVDAVAAVDRTLTSGPPHDTAEPTAGDTPVDQGELTENDDEAAVVLHGAQRARRGGRRLWPATAAVAAVLALVVSLVLLQDGGGEPSTTTGATGTPGATEYLLPDWLPEDWEPQVAVLATGSEGANVVAGEVVIYGDGALDDPWAGPRLTAIRSEQPPDETTNEDVGRAERHEAITIAGHEGVLVPDDRQPAAWAVEGEHSLGVTGVDVAAELVADAAEHLRDDPAIGAEGLPNGYEEIARGPLGAIGPGGVGQGVEEGLTVAYGEPSARTPALVLTQRPAAGPEAAELLRMLGDDPIGSQDEPVEIDVVETEVRGETAYAINEVVGAVADGSQEGILEQVIVISRGSFEGGDAAENGPSMVQWFDPAVGMVVTVTAADLTSDVDDAALDQFLDGLQVADQDALDDLLDTYGMAPGDIAPVLDDTVIATGESAREPWDLHLTHIDDGGLDLALAYGDDGNKGNAFHLAAGDQASLWDGLGTYFARTQPPGGNVETVGVFGLAQVEANAVTVDHPDGTTYTLELHGAPERLTDGGDIDLPDFQVFVGFVPTAETSGELTAVDADGDPLPGWPRRLALD